MVRTGDLFFEFVDPVAAVAPGESSGSMLFGGRVVVLRLGLVQVGASKVN